MIVYLAQAIDRSRLGSLSERVADDVTGELLELGHTVFSPKTSWRASEPDPRIQTLNESVLLASDVMVAVLWSDDKTIGVPWEIALARQNGIPVVLITDLAPSLVMLAHMAGVGVVLTTNASGAARAVDISRRPERLAARWDGQGEAPRAGYPGDAGFDLVVSQTVRILSGEMADVASDVAVQLPPGMWGLITGRSSSWKRKLLVKDSVIDAGFRGVLFASCMNLGSEPLEVTAGERIAQLVPMPLTAAGIVWQRGDLTSSERGTAGFGSSGR